MVKRRGLFIGLLVLPAVAAFAAGSVGAQAAGITRAPDLVSTPRGLAFSSPRASTAMSSPRAVKTAAIACDGAFDLVASPNGTGHNDIFATSAVSTNDVWAVGVQTIGGNDRTLAEHWNGTTWTIVATPNPTTTYWDDLNGVVAIATNDVWAVGDYQINATGYVSTFAAHWNGSTWALVTATQNPMNYNWLFAVDAVSSTDVWAVGTSWSAGYFTLVEHWDGSTWARVTSPNKNNSSSFASNQLFSVSAFSSTDIWAVGTWVGTNFQSLAEHWDGGSWSVVTTPNDTGDNEIAAVAALEGGHAAGVGLGGGSSVTPAHAEVWDLKSGGGSAASALGALGAGDNVLLGVAHSGASVWAVGFWRATTVSARQTLAFPATWDSSSHILTWGSVGSSASPASVNNVLFAVAAVSPSVFWASGYMNSGAFDQSLLESNCGLQLAASAPGASFIGAPLSLTVTAKNPNGSTATGYRGTVHVTSTDLSATLPSDYTFTTPDAGVHTFAGVVLNTLYSQKITVADTVTPFITDTVTISVACHGACAGATGSAGSRGADTTASGTPGSRSTNPSAGGAPPGPSGARIAASRAGAAESSGSQQAVAAAPPATAGTATSAPPAVATAGASPGAASGIVADSLVSHVAVVGAPGEAPWIVVALGLLAVALPVALWLRRRENRRLDVDKRA